MQFRVLVLLTSGQIVGLPNMISWIEFAELQLAQRLGNYINLPRG